MEQLPEELILHIVHCKIYLYPLVRFELTCLVLEATEIVPLQLASKRIHKTTRDNGLWKELCLEDSHAEAARKRRDFLYGAPIPIQEPTVFELQRVVAQSVGNNRDVETSIPVETRKEARATARPMACWDPTYPHERVDWYSEYTARHAPLSLSWLQQPISDSNAVGEKLETRGLGLLKNAGNNIAVGPLDDGSVCLWNIGQENAAPDPEDGRIIACSKPSLLSVNGPDGTNWQNPSSSRAKMTSTGVVECVSVDKARNKAYFAVQSGLNEVDLNTLQISSYDRYPFSISALSEATHPIPLTVGTTLSLHIHDPRIGNNGRRSSYTYLSESADIGHPIDGPQNQTDFTRLHNGDPSGVLDYATLFQPLPLSILHLNPSSTIYVAGRFPSILHYDRRFFPNIVSTIHSGGSLCSISSLPTPNSPTLVAGGEYNGKGSLELYPLTPPSSSEATEAKPPTRNRASASRSKILSLTPHGTRILFSDSDGQLRWVERDGSTLVRRWNINTYSSSPTDTLPTQGIFNNDLNEGDVARKLLPVSSKERSEVLLWTGERIGVLGFKKKPRFALSADGGDEADGVENGGSGEGFEERDYGRMMRRALERQANEVRFVRGLGLGLGG
jgi:hypothetical protein